MQSVLENIQKNKTHYDHEYSQVNVDNIVAAVRRIRKLLDDTTKVDTTWHDLYHYGNFADRIKNKRVFELGCGDGLNALLMATFGADVVANDISSESERIIREAAVKLGIDNVQPISGNFANLPFDPHSFDFVVGRAFLHHLTHELEHEYLSKLTLLLRPEGEARFIEPAVNSQGLDKVRWMIPVPGRPSVFSKQVFTKWKERDPHPERDNSSDHFIQIGKKFFHEVEIVPIGCIGRFCRLLPKGKLRRRYARWAHRVERKLPKWFQHKAARSQLIIYRYPRT